MPDYATLGISPKILPMRLPCDKQDVETQFTRYTMYVNLSKHSDYFECHGKLHWKTEEAVSWKENMHHVPQYNDGSLKIYDEGFRPSSGGMLGPRVYLRRSKEKASHYPDYAGREQLAMLKVKV
ncbi:GCRV-induced 2i-like protein [Labeo rohita]|uniref:GCRV-induced 2i-like protein n=1 Tax=Labeo rohita TaxID=84645 RepID=A0A498NGK9_LABRO|nr:GCRV-induced 2i-like protein [Labeo rohita]RXN30961.1 GCRV-induced 2i-like protein [Labeo rohita]